MSESEVSQIRDEDVLRRMWQATEDFGRKKEIRAHMYRLREERLRNLYSPEPGAGAGAAGKGCEFSAVRGHGQSFADQSFQSMKSKEVRDAGSPPKEFTYRGQDLKELSNAGWNVESEDRTTDDGRTHVKFVNANIEGQYDVEGGRGKFAAVDKQRRAVSEHQDARSHTRRDELASDTAAHEHVVRRSDDGTRVASTTTSSNTSTEYRQVSSTTHDAPPLEQIDRRTLNDTDRNERVTRISNTDDYDRTLRANDTAKAELVSRKVEYPDDSTKVIVETRVLPDGTRVTSTRREFRVPAHSTRAEHHSRSESQTYSSHRSTDHRDSSSSTTRRTTDRRAQDIVDSQRNVDDYDFKRQIREYTSNENEDYADTQQHHITKTNKKVNDHSRTDDEYTQKRYETRVDNKVIDQSTTSRDDHAITQRDTVDRRTDNRVDETDRHHTTRTQDHDFQRNVLKETHHIHASEEKIHNVTRERKDNDEIVQHVTKDRTVVEDEIRIPKDKTVPVDRVNNIPKYDTPTIERAHDIPRDRTVPVDDHPCDAPQNQSVPTERYQDVPQKVPRNISGDIPTDRIVANEKPHYTNREVEEVIERKTSSEHYQTTYQNDYQTRKVSTDWSPTHQAWASTLRADTPSTTRPSTRASSPGSKTFKSSTSSLRSSVSPDKTFRKPSSRGGSPNKMDRFSPTRTVTSDRYSSTHSTHSVTEEKINKTTSPERKPPTGRSARPGYSPERKQDINRQRPSLSPEKRPNNLSDRPLSSPERNPTDGRPRVSPAQNEIPKSPTKSTQSPERRITKPSDEHFETSPYRSTTSPNKKLVDNHPNRSSQRLSPSPDRKQKSPAVGQPRTSPSQSGYPTNDTPRKSSTSPVRKLGFQQPSTQDLPVKRPSVSPDRKPSYMEPTASNQPENKYNRPSKPNDEPNRKSPSKQAPYSSDRKPQDFNKTTKIKEDHYRFVDEETKVYSQSNVDNKVTKTSRIEGSRPRNKSPSSNIPTENSPDYGASQPHETFTRGKSPVKDKIIVTENDELYGRIDKTAESINVTTQRDKQTDDNITISCSTKTNEFPEGKGFPSREKSPSKYDTYDKKKPREEINTAVTTITSDDTKDSVHKHETLTRRETSPKKEHGTPLSPSKKSPRNSISPPKSFSKDTKYQHTTDFISTERNAEEITKKNTTKDRPRQLVTPSSSPTRKPKPTETEPSTGQSSPTTSVSGFVYFGSPLTERPVVTDLDEFYPHSENLETTRRPETLDVKRSPSPSKIPCRSPSPEKHVPSPKDSLPRKSSLKKPSTDFNQASPVEKPPTSFRVSPTDDRSAAIDHKVVKKDRPSEPETGEVAAGEPKLTDKQKPPLQRRETYDDRCKKILGLVDDLTTDIVTKENKKQTRKPDNQTSPSVSPCDSPGPNESSLFSNYSASKKTNIVDVTDFISHEQEDFSKTTLTRDQQKTKILSRDSSPTKLKDIITDTTVVVDKTRTAEQEDISSRPSTRQSPEKELSDDSSSKRPSESPDRKRIPSPSKSPRANKTLPRSNLSPDRKITDKHIKDTTSSIDTTIKSTLDTASFVNDVQENIKSTKSSQPTRSLKSPTREKPTEQVHSRGSSPSKHQSIDSSSLRKPSPERKRTPDRPKDYIESVNDCFVDTTRPQESPDKIPSYMKSTTAVTSKFDSLHKTESVDEIYEESRTVEKKEPKTSSPTRQTPRVSSPTKPPGLDNSSLKRTDTSPQRKMAPSTQTSDNHIPGYMSTTKTTTSKFDQVSISEDVKETTKTSVTKTRTSSISPTRKSTQPKSPSERRTPSPTKQSNPSDISIDKKPVKSRLSSPTKDSVTKKPESKHPTVSPSLHATPEKVPGYMKPTASITLKHDTAEYVSTTNEEIEETITSTVTDKKYTRDAESPSRYIPKSAESPVPEYPRTTSPTRPLSSTCVVPKKQDSLVRNPSKQRTADKPSNRHLEGISPTKEDKTPSFMKNTTATSSKFKTTTTEEIEEDTTLKHVTKKQSIERTPHKTSNNNRPRTLSPSKVTDKLPRTSIASPDRELGPISPVKESSIPENKHSKQTQGRPSYSPERPSYMKPTASITSKFDTTTTTQQTQETLLSNVIEPKSPSPKNAMEPDRQSPGREPKKTPEEPRQLRTPSPAKKATTITETNTDFIVSEREQEILNKVQKSLRKLSPERKEKSPSRERSPTKSTTSLQDLDITSSETIETEKIGRENLTEIVEDQCTITSKVPRPTQLKNDKTNDQNVSSKPSSRNVSPIKRAPTTPTSNKTDKTPESLTKSRQRPQSPQQPKASGIKPREHISSVLTRKPTPATLSTSRIERLTTDAKKTNGVIKQQVITKTTNRSIPSPTGKPSETEKKLKDNVSPKKSTVTRTASDVAIKSKKTSSPQRMKSKPEIQVNDLSTKSPKYQKPIIKEPHSKLPTKPKSATSLNTSVDENDIIIDVQQSKSSRENSPDRICPTPINFTDDVGVPRFPDEVSEPDDELVKRNHHTIHETESVVDDIVEICEDEELFVKKSDMEVITEYDDSLLSVNDKVNKFTNKIHLVQKPKDTTTTFKDTERRVHSDFIDENLKSDECLLTVSEKVNKFAKGPRDTKDSRSPSRKITDEYDRDTVYTDDYTKLSVNDKAHLFVETAENIKTTKIKPAQKMERPDLSKVDESLKSDDCLLSVSDKVNKFVKTAEQYFSETQEIEEKETKIKQQHEKIIKQIVDEDDEETHDTKETDHTKETTTIRDKSIDRSEVVSRPTKEPKRIQPKVKDYSTPNNKPVDRVPAVKITTLRSSEAVKKAKALFENIASTQNTTQKETTHTTKTTKLTDIGVIKKSPKTDSTTVLHPSIESVSPQVLDVDDETESVLQIEKPSSGTPHKPQHAHIDEKPRSSPNRLTAHSPEVPRSKSPMRQSVEVTTTKTVLSRYPAATRAESPRQRPESPRHHTESPKLRADSDKPGKVPGYLRPTKTSQIKEEPKVIEEAEVSSRRGSGKFGVELRRTSVERSTVSSERRRSVEHHQPCIEDIYDLDLLEQMLEKVSGYEQRRRIRAQIRVVKNQSEHVTESNTYTKTTKHSTAVPKMRSPERKVKESPDRALKSTPQRTISPERLSKSTPQKNSPDRALPKEPAVNGHVKGPSRTQTPTRQRPQSPEKPAPKSTLAPRTPVRQPSPDKRRPTSPSKATPKPKGSRFNEYASAYMKKVGLNETDKMKFTDSKTKKTAETKQAVKHETQQKVVQEFTTTKSFTERTSSKDVIEIVQTNGKRSPSPEQRQSPERRVQFPEHKTPVAERKAHSPERRPYTPDHKAQSPDRKMYSPVQKTQSPDRLYQRTPSPDFKRPKSDTGKETIIKTVYNIEKKIPSKPVQEEKPSWVTNRNLKKITSESRTFSSKKIESEKPKYRAPSPSKVIAKPTDVITSSYGPGPLDADGKPLFGIKALRNGATNFQVKGTVIRQEFHSRNGGEPEGSVSVTAYSSQPEELARLLESQGAELPPPSRLHGLAAITTTKKFGGDTGNTINNVHTKEERASLEQFTHHDRRVEHLENRAYDTRIQDVSDTRVEEITDNTRRTDKKENRQDKIDRSTRREEKVTEVKRQKVEERREKMEKREDKKTVRQSSVKSLTEKYIKSANEGGKCDRSSYPKAGLILRTTSMRDSVSSDDAAPAGVQRADSEHSVCSVEETVVSTSTEHATGGSSTRTTVVTRHQPASAATVTTRRTVHTQEPVTTHSRHGHTTTERSFLDSTTKVTGVQDILTRMKNADIVIQEGDSMEDSEARALLNKFLGATVLMAGMQGYVSEQPEGRVTVHQESVRSSSGGTVTSRSVQEIDLDQCWDERLLKKLLDECTDYEQRRRLRARIRTLMAEQEACASAVTEALGAGAGAEGEGGEGAEAREEEEVTVTSSVRRDSSDKTVSSSTTTRTSKVIEMTRPAPKPVSPFAKFRQLEKQNSTNSPNSPKTPQSPGSPSQPYFKFTDPALQSSALTIKERLLQWCRDKTRDYENVKLENFSTSWADGLAFCALVHHFLPDAFDYSKLTPDRRRHNFTLAFKVADEKAGIYPLLDVDDMVAMRKPDWKCVFTYVQAIYRRFKDEQ